MSLFFSNVCAGNNFKAAMENIKKQFAKQIETEVVRSSRKYDSPWPDDIDIKL